METILDRIIAKKKEEVARLKKDGVPVKTAGRSEISFLSALKEGRELAVIAEFKRASPSKGMINEKANPAEQAKLYEAAGADAVSVLTDAPFFKGSFQDLAKIRKEISLPVLCKDFIIDEIQIDAALGAGADMILLIAAALTEDRLRQLYEYARSKNLDVLMEVHNEEELKKALATDNPIIGVNNRDLKTFTVDLQITENLGPLIKREGRFLISESGLKTGEDVLRVRRAGADGILVGETFMRQSRPEQSIKEMKAAGS